MGLVFKGILLLFHYVLKDSSFHSFYSAVNIESRDNIIGYACK